jgi:hypothetical protein
MSLHSEKVNALKRAREFLRDLMNPKKYPKIPLKVRMEARASLKHFVADYDIKIRNDEGKWRRI